MSTAKKFSVPGVFWAILIVILVPALVPVLERVFPAAAYQWSAVLVVVLVSVAKTVEIVYRRQIGQAMAQDAIQIQPAAMAQDAAGAPDGDDYTWEEVRAPEQPALSAWLLG